MEVIWPVRENGCLGGLTAVEIARETVVHAEQGQAEMADVAQNIRHVRAEVAAAGLAELPALERHGEQAPANAVLVFDHADFMAAPVEGEGRGEAGHPGPEDQNIMRILGFGGFHRWFGLREKRAGEWHRRHGAKCAAEEVTAARAA